MTEEKKDLNREDLLQLTLETGKSYTFTLGQDKGELLVKLLCHEGKEPVPDMDYQITGPHGVTYAGKTATDGTITHKEPLVPIDHYTLKINKREYPIESRIPGLGPQELRLDGWPEKAPIEMNPEADVVILRKRSGSPPAGFDQDVPCFRQGTKDYNKDEDTHKDIPLVRQYHDGQEHRTIVKCGCGLACLTMAVACAGLKPWRFSTEKGDWEVSPEPMNPRSLADFFINYAEKFCVNDKGKTNVWRVFLKSGGALNWGSRDTGTPDAAEQLSAALSFLVQKNLGDPNRKVGYRFLWSGAGDPANGAARKTWNEEIRAGRPLILLGNHGEASKTNPKAGGHYVLCVGYIKDGKKYYYYANDPARKGGPNPYERIKAGDLESFENPPKSQKGGKATHRSQCHDLLHDLTHETGPYTNLKLGMVLTGLDDLWDLVPWSPC